MERVYKREGFIIYKLIPCLIVMMFAFMCLFGSYVCADFNITYNDQSYTLSNLNLPYDSYAIFATTMDSNLYFRVYSWDSSTSKFCYINNENGYYDCKCVDINNPSSKHGYSWTPKRVSSSDVDFSNCSWIDKDGTISSAECLDFIYTNTNIYSPYDTNEVVFQAPPQQVEGIIAKETQGVEMNKILQEITAILPIVLVVIVGLIALRKAIQFLIRQMKGA